MLQLRSTHLVAHIIAVVCHHDRDYNTNIHADDN
jgi:hypothetical protein